MGLTGLFASLEEEASPLRLVSGAFKAPLSCTKVLSAVSLPYVDTRRPFPGPTESRLRVSAPAPCTAFLISSSCVAMSLSASDAEEDVAFSASDEAVGSEVARAANDLELDRGGRGGGVRLTSTVGSGVVSEDSEVLL